VRIVALGRLSLQRGDRVVVGAHEKCTGVYFDSETTRVAIVVEPHEEGVCLMMLVLKALPLVDKISVLIHALLAQEPSDKLIVFLFNQRCNQLDVVVCADHRNILEAVVVHHEVTEEKCCYCGLVQFWVVYLQFHAESNRLVDGRVTQQGMEIACIRDAYSVMFNSEKFIDHYADLILRSDPRIYLPELIRLLFLRLFSAT
jgi:hypothetical protein